MASRCSSWSSSSWPSPSTTSTASTTRPTPSPPPWPPAPSIRDRRSSWRRRSTSSARSPGRRWPRRSAPGWSRRGRTTQAVVIAALLGAIVWNLITWLLGLPSSSSHALIGGLLGATFVAAGAGAFKVGGIVGKVLIPMVVSPLLGFAGAFALMLAIYWVFRKARRRAARPRVPAAPGPVGRVHGLLPRLERRPEDDGHHHPGAVLGRSHPRRQRAALGDRVAATALSLGTAVGGWRIMKTMGHRVAKLEPVHGFAAETTAATILFTDRPLRHAGLDHPCHLERDHGRRLEPRPARRPLGRGPQHPHRLGPDHPRRGRRGRPAWVVLHLVGLG